MSDETVLEARDLAKHYALRRGPFAAPAIVRALDGVSFTLSRQRTLAVVGESGCGKSTLARLVTMIELPTAGSLRIAGHEIADAGSATLARLRPTVQIVFQNPYGSLNPRQRIGEALEEPLLVNTGLRKAERRERAEAMMAKVGLRPEHYDRYPHMFSGGQRQRIAIARAVMLEPQILVLDEPVSALDSESERLIQQSLASLMEHKTVIAIAHRLSTIAHLDRLIVMENGQIVEDGTHTELLNNNGLYARLWNLQSGGFLGG